MYYLAFEFQEDAEDFRQFLKEKTAIELDQAYKIGDSENWYYEYETYGYPGFVMLMVHRICYNDGVEYSKIRRLSRAVRAKYLEDQLFSHAMSDVKTWRPPGPRSQEFRWVQENLGLSEQAIRTIVQRAEQKYYRWLKMDSRYSLLLGVVFFFGGFLFTWSKGPTSWPALLMFSFALILLLFSVAKALQFKKKKQRRRLP